MAVQLDMEEDLEPTRELSELVTLCREAQRTWKAYMHSQNRQEQIEVCAGVA